MAKSAMQHRNQEFPKEMGGQALGQLSIPSQFKQMCRGGSKIAKRLIEGNLGPGGGPDTNKRASINCIWETIMRISAMGRGQLP